MSHQNLGNKNWAGFYFDEKSEVIATNADQLIVSILFSFDEYEMKYKAAFFTFFQKKTGVMAKESTFIFDPVLESLFALI